MSTFLHNFFSDPLLGFGAVLTLGFISFLGWSDFSERRARRIRRRADEVHRSTH